MTSEQMNLMAARIHSLHEKWWIDIHTGERIVRNQDELLMLVVTELAEAVEGVRKNLMDDKLTHRKMEEVEMADAFIRLMDYAGGFKLDLVTLTPHAVQDNKAEALFHIVKLLRPECAWISLSIAQIEAYCHHFNLDLFGAVEEKLEFNQKRKDHTHEARRAEGGKKF